MICVTGAAGFIGHWLVRYLKNKGYRVRAIDYKPPKYEVPADEAWWQCDLRAYKNAVDALDGADWVFALAADMGGMGYIGYHHWTILHDNLTINLNTAKAADIQGVERVLYASSACVYPEWLQQNTQARELSEDDAWLGKPDTAYGIEKLVSEDVYRYMGINSGVEVRTARFHNIYGRNCTWRGGREKAPAALCRKVAEAKLSGKDAIEIWGDGEQSRSFCYIDDCLEMLYLLMRSDYHCAMNIGTDESVTINQLVDIIADHAGVELKKEHDLTKPQGVRGRNADLSKMHEVLAYELQTPLENGIAKLYPWVKEQVWKSRS